MFAELSNEALAELQSLAVKLFGEHRLFGWMSDKATDEDVRRQHQAVGRRASEPVVLEMPRMGDLELQLGREGLAHFGVELEALRDLQPHRAGVLRELSTFTADLFIALDPAMTGTN